MKPTLIILCILVSIGITLYFAPACGIPNLEASEDAMTQPPGNAYSRQVNINKHLQQIMAPGIRADLVGRNTQAVGIVKEGTIDITAGVFKADVEVDTRFPGRTITVRNVQFNVQVSEGDVVSLQIMGGQPINGVFGSPVRPKGPNVIYFDGPTTASEWATDESASTLDRARNAALQAYTIPFNISGVPNVNTPITINSTGAQLLILPDTLRVQTKPAAATVEISAKLNGGLRIVGGPRAGNYAIRYPTGQLVVDAVNIAGTFGLAQMTSHQGIEAAGIRTGPVSLRSFGGASYVDMINYPLPANGQHLLFTRTTILHPEIVGGIYSIALLTTVPQITDLQYYRQIIHPEYIHPTYLHPSYVHPSPGSVHPGHTHPGHTHPEYNFWVWEDLTTPQAGETYSIWLGIGDIQINIVEIGTGGR